MWDYEPFKGLPFRRARNWRERLLVVAWVAVLLAFCAVVVLVAYGAPV